MPSLFPLGVIHSSHCSLACACSAIMMQQQLNPNIFLFQQLVGQMLEFIKRHVKRSKLDEIAIGTVLAQDKSMDLNKYNELLLLGLASPKTKQPLLLLYEKLVKGKLMDSRSLPQNLISTLVDDFEGESSVLLARLFTAVLTSNHLLTSIDEKSRCLKYLLEGTRKKANGPAFAGMLQECIVELSQQSQPAVNSFLVHFVNHLANEVEYHCAQPIEYSLILHSHDGQGKYGKCFICGAPAPNYDKEVLVPLCGFDCKASLKELRLRMDQGQSFDLLNWLVEQSVHGDQLIFREIGKQLRSGQLSERVTEKQLKILLPEILKNAEKGDQQIVHECHRIFVSIFESYRIPFKNELKAYIKVMVGHLEQQKDATNKLALLRFFAELFRNAENINSIYANYDCKYYESNLLEQQMGLISRMSISAKEDEPVRMEAKKCIAALLKGQLQYLRKRPISMKEIPQQVDGELLRQKKIKSHTQKAILLFNEKPETGINYLRQNYFENQEMSANDIAMFIRQNEEIQSKLRQVKLKKDKVGEFFGSPKPFNQDVYKAYLQLISFDGMTIDDAMRELLNHFSLPKQAQEIERVLDHFTNKYFPISGTSTLKGCYQLGYTLLMLQTSLHNPNVKPGQRLTLQIFQSICSGIEGGVEKEQSERLFHSIQTRPMSMRPEFSSEYVLSKAYLNPYEQYQQSSSGQLLSMLRCIWQYIYVALVDRDNVDGLYEAIQLYGGCDMEEAQGFVSALIKLAEKGNIRAYDSVLRLAAFDNLTLSSCWEHIVKFMFQMEDSQIAEQSSFDMSIIDQILTATSGLPPQKLVEFLQQFCHFSSSDFKDNKYDRELFVLKHVVEVVEYNLPRLKTLWTYVWPLLQDFFVKLCLHPRSNIGMAAIDSLKQLTMKLMRIPEDDTLQQVQFLEPFQYVYDRSGPTMKELIINIIGMLVCKEMNTGWEVLQSILEKADQTEAIVKVVDRVITVGLDAVRNAQKLHQILIKELLTLNENESHLLNKILQLTVKLASHLNNDRSYLQTLQALAEKYEMTEEPNLLRCFFDLIEAIPHRTPQMFDLVIRLHSFTNRARDYARSSLISSYTNMMDKSFLIDCFDKWQELWFMNLDGRNRRAFLAFFYEGINDHMVALPDQQISKTIQFLLQKHDETLPTELLKLATLDADFQCKLQDLPSSPNSKSDLIELPLQKEVYEYMCIFHLTILKLLRLLIEKRTLSKAQLLGIESAAKKSFQLASQFNQKVLLRYFLWKNGFMSNQNELPGLLKQSIMSLDILIEVLANDELEQLGCSLLKAYHSKYLLIKRINLMDNILLKPVYKQETDSYLLSFKPLVIKLFDKLKQLPAKQDPSDQRPIDLYQAILNILQECSDRQLVSKAKHILRKLLPEVV